VSPGPIPPIRNPCAQGALGKVRVNIRTPADTRVSPGLPGSGAHGVLGSARCLRDRLLWS
jgi:hypothetical protein